MILLCFVHAPLDWQPLSIHTGSHCSCAQQANATLKAKVDILRSNLAEVRGQAQRSEQLEAELKELSGKLAQAEAAVSAAGESADKLTDSTAAGHNSSVTADGEDVAALRQRLREAEAKMAAAAGEADEAQQWQADETAELLAKLKKVEARLAAVTSEAEVGLHLLKFGYLHQCQFQQKQADQQSALHTGCAGSSGRCCGWAAAAPGCS